MDGAVQLTEDWGCGRLWGVMFNLSIQNVIGFRCSELVQIANKEKNGTYKIWNVDCIKSINGVLKHPENDNDYMPFKLVMVKRIRENDFTIAFVISNPIDYNWFDKLENHDNSIGFTLNDLAQECYSNVVSESNLLYHSSLPWKSSEIIPLSEVIQSYEVDFQGAAETNIAKKILQHLW